MNCPKCRGVMVYDREVARLPKGRPSYFLHRWKCLGCRVEVLIPTEET